MKSLGPRTSAMSKDTFILLLFHYNKYMRFLRENQTHPKRYYLDSSANGSDSWRLNHEKFVDFQYVDSLYMSNVLVNAYDVSLVVSPGEYWRVTSLIVIGYRYHKSSAEGDVQHQILILGMCSSWLRDELCCFKRIDRTI